LQIALCGCFSFGNSACRTASNDRGMPDAASELTPPADRMDNERSQKMKTHFKPIISITAMGFAVALAYSSQAAGSTVVVTSPGIVVSQPVAATPVPETYVWDGSEYVGVVNDQYYYLAPGNVWMVMDPPRFHRFQDWQKGHRDWREHATRNVRYRNAEHGVRPQPMREDRSTKPDRDQDRDRDRDRDHGQHSPPQ
jgi:hypothetical protein